MKFGITKKVNYLTPIEGNGEISDKYFVTFIDEYTCYMMALRQIFLS